MAKLIDLHIRQEIVTAVDAGEGIKPVARRFGVDPGTVRNLLRLRESTGSLVPLPHNSVRARKLHEAARLQLRDLVRSDPTATQEEYAARLAAACGIKVDQSTIGRELKKWGFRRVKAQRPSAKAQRPSDAEDTSPSAAEDTSPSKPARYRVPDELVYRPELDVRAPAPRRTWGTKKRKKKAPGKEPALRAKRYPSDLTDAQWELVAPFIPMPKAGGRPAEHDRRDIVDAIIYVLRTGCQWRALPHDFPPWSTVYDLFRQWRNAGVWQQANRALVERTRLAVGRRSQPSTAIIDSQSVRTTEKGGSVDTMAASA